MSKRCDECKHYAVHYYWDGTIVYCCHPEAPVITAFGTGSGTVNKECHEMRKTDGKCGPEAKLFEPKRGKE